MVVDGIVIAVVIAILFLCIRSLFRGGDECSDCAMGAECSMHGEGECMAAQTMIDDAERAVEDMETARR